MKHYYAFILLLFCCFFKWNNVSAQAPAIMDANVSWTSSGGGSYDGLLIIYLTDSTGVSGVQVRMGSQPGSANLDSVLYTGATNGNFGSNTSISTSQNNISVALGNFSYHSDYYVDVEVLLQGGTYKEIQIHSSN
jgi:hypothetical protein